MFLVGYVVYHFQIYSQFDQVGDIFLRLDAIWYIVNLTLIFTFSMVMFFAYLLSRRRSNYFLYFSFFLLCSLPMVINNFSLLGGEFPGVSLPILTCFSLGLTPLLFLRFYLEYFSYSDQIKQRWVWAMVGCFVIVIALSIYLLGPVEQHKANLKNVQSLMIWLSCLGTMLYLSIMLAGSWRLKNNLGDSRSLQGIFLLLLVPFIMGKGLESLMLIMEGLSTVPYFWTEYKHYSGGYVLLYVPLMIGLIGHVYTTQQDLNIRLNESRIKILEILEETSKDVPKEVLLKSVLDNICNLTQAEIGCIVLFDKEEKARIKACSGVTDVSVYDVDISQNKSLKFFMKSRKDQFLQKRKYQLYVNGNKYEAGSVMMVHLSTHNNSYGFVILANSVDGRAFFESNFDSVKMIIPSISKYLENRELFETLNQQYDGVVTAFAETINSKDRYTRFHCVGVTVALEYLGRELDIEITRELKTAALLHDLGKIMIDPYILEKPGKLNDEEWSLIREHPIYSGQILESIPGFEKVAMWASMHHEAFDGSGYPYGLKEGSIPIEAQLINAADFLDALSTNRSYRVRASFEEIEDLINKLQNRFNPRIKKAMINLLHNPEFQNHYDLKSLNFKMTSDLDEVRLKYINERVANITRSLQSALDLVSDIKEPKSLEHQTMHDFHYYIDRFNQLYNMFIEQLDSTLNNTLNDNFDNFKHGPTNYDQDSSIDTKPECSLKKVS